MPPNRFQSIQTNEITESHKDQLINLVERSPQVQTTLAAYKEQLAAIFHNTPQPDSEILALIHALDTDASLLHDMLKDETNRRILDRIESHEALKNNLPVRRLVEAFHGRIYHVLKGSATVGEVVKLMQGSNYVVTTKSLKSSTLDLADKEILLDARAGLSSHYKRAFDLSLPQIIHHSAPADDAELTITDLEEHYQTLLKAAKTKQLKESHTPDLPSLEKYREYLNEDLIAGFTQLQSQLEVFQGEHENETQIDGAVQDLKDKIREENKQLEEDHRKLEPSRLITDSSGTVAQPPSDAQREVITKRIDKRESRIEKLEEQIAQLKKQKIKMKKSVNIRDISIFEAQFPPPNRANLARLADVRDLTDYVWNGITADYTKIKDEILHSNGSPYELVRNALSYLKKREKDVSAEIKIKTTNKKLGSFIEETQKTLSAMRPLKDKLNKPSKDLDKSWEKVEEARQKLMHVQALGAAPEELRSARKHLKEVTEKYHETAGSDPIQIAEQTARILAGRQALGESLLSKFTSDGSPDADVSNASLQNFTPTEIETLSQIVFTEGKMDKAAGQEEMRLHFLLAREAAEAQRLPEDHPDRRMRLDAVRLVQGDSRLLHSLAVDNIERARMVDAFQTESSPSPQVVSLAAYKARKQSAEDKLNNDISKIKDREQQEKEKLKELDQELTSLKKQLELEQKSLKSEEQHHTIMGKHHGEKLAEASADTALNKVKKPYHLVWAGWHRRNEKKIQKRILKLEAAIHRKEKTIQHQQYKIEKKLLKNSRLEHKYELKKEKKVKELQALDKKMLAAESATSKSFQKNQTLLQRRLQPNRIRRFWNTIRNEKWVNPFGGSAEQLNFYYSQLIRKLQGVPPEDQMNLLSTDKNKPKELTNEEKDGKDISSQPQAA